MKNRNFFILLFYISFLLVSCKNIVDSDLNLKIISPKENWIYYSDVQVVLSANVKSNKLIWKSSKDGILGNGSNINVFLTTGEHEIILADTVSGIQTSVFINVIDRVLSNQQNQILIQHFPVEFYSTVDNCSLYTLDGTIKEFRQEDLDFYNSNEISTEILRDSVGKINNSFVVKNVISNSRSSSRTIIENYERDFFVINTKDQISESVVKANLFISEQDLDVYVDSSVTDENIKLNIKKCIDNYLNIISPRLKQIWGTVQDIDCNNKLTFLFTHTINDEKVAIGFFNQKDFFKKDTDLNSLAYNPNSNEMDIIYIAIPTEINFNYSISSISATIAHEVTHAINFSNKTYNRIGNDEYKIMETFLDEGLSHISEILCGYGISGGNSIFVNTYLQNTSSYSFCKNNIYGQNDSVGQRGAICLFLYYLFNKAGGIECDKKNEFIDLGGISFLNAIINSLNYGWEAIGEYFYKDTDFIFKEFCNEILNSSISDIFDFTKTDLETGEKFVDFVEIKPITMSDMKIDILPYSLCKIFISENSWISFNSKQFSGNCYFLYK